MLDKSLDKHFGSNLECLMSSVAAPLKLDLQQLHRFMAKIEKAVIREEFGECWVWTGATTDKGYGKFYLGKREDGKKDTRLAHRVSFEHFNQEVIRPGFIVDHECSHKSCVRPAHLKQVSNVRNLQLASQRRPWKRRNQYSKD